MSREASVDHLVEKLKSSRDSPAALKTKFIMARSRCGQLPIFAVEGPDDKVVYSQWIRRIRGDLRYEYFVCSGKKQVLALKIILDRDLHDLGSSVFYFIDRDFDELAGHVHSPCIFMTETYSVENLLVCEQVLEDILKVELHCEANPEVRQGIVALFHKVYGDFLQCTAELNRRLFASKKVPIPRQGDFPNRINQIAVVHLDRVETHVRTPQEIIALTREPTIAEMQSIERDFIDLGPKERFRGKFAFLFFKRWIEELVGDYSSANTSYFGSIDRSSRARQSEINFSSIASRSPLPTGLDAFIQSIPSP
jgi:Protein of unknown function (DUF4435)